MPDQAIRVDTHSAGVAVLTIDQPESRVNVLSRELWTNLEEAVDALARRADLRGLVIASGKPGVFIAGADLKLLAEAPVPNDPAVRGFIEHGLRVLEKLESLPFPTCAALDGAALGGGLEVALACDTRVAGTHPKLQLGLPEVKLGLIPGWGGTQRLPRIIGLKNAVEMVTTGRGVGLQEASTIGLVDATIDSAGLIDRAVEIVADPDQRSRLLERREAKRNPFRQSDLVPLMDVRGAAAEAVRVIFEGTAVSLAVGIELETRAFLQLAGAPESKRLIAEFFAARKK